VNFASHGLSGSALYALAYHHYPTEVRIGAATVGFIEGALPDVIEWSARQFGIEGMKERTHEGDLVWLSYPMPAYGLHILLDYLVFHNKDCLLYNMRGWVEAVLVVLSLDILMVSFL
jgi:hypothetical protein